MAAKSRLLSSCPGVSMCQPKHSFTRCHEEFCCGDCTHHGQAFRACGRWGSQHFWRATSTRAYACGAVSHGYGSGYSDSVSSLHRPLHGIIGRIAATNARLRRSRVRCELLSPALALRATASRSSGRIASRSSMSCRCAKMACDLMFVSFKEAALPTYFSLFICLF